MTFRATSGVREIDKYIHTDGIQRFHDRRVARRIRARDARHELQVARCLDRSGYRVALTEAGRLFHERTRVFLHELGHGLGLAHPDSGLLPTDSTARAQAVRGMVFIAANCYSAISIIDYPERFAALGSLS